MTCLVHIHFMKSACVKHLTLSESFCISSENKAVLTVIQYDTYGIIIYIAVFFAVRSDYLTFGFSDIYLSADLSFFEVNFVLFNSVKELVEIYSSRYIRIVDMRYDELTDIECLDYLGHTAHMVGVRMSADNVIELFNAEVIEILHRTGSIFRFSAVNEHILVSVSDEYTVTLPYVYVVYFYLALSRQYIAVLHIGYHMSNIEK